MGRNCGRTAVIGVVAAALSVLRGAPVEIPQHRAQQIWDAAPAKPRVTPKKVRRVLLWLTPPHLMQKDPHKGYCIPYGTCAIETLGRKTGAFETLTSGDLALYLPERIKRFDAIVMNNSSGPWITPTDADLERSRSSVTERIRRRSRGCSARA